MNITNYKGYKGFYDLRDYKLPVRGFKSLWRIQEFLFFVQKNIKYYKEFELATLENIKELSAKYQQMLFKFERKLKGVKQ